MLREAGHDDAADRLLGDHPLAPPFDPSDPDGRFDANADRLFTVLEGRVPDGATARDALETGTPAWVSGAADPDGRGEPLQGVFVPPAQVLLAYFTHATASLGEATPGTGASGRVRSLVVIDVLHASSSSVRARAVRTLLLHLGSWNRYTT